MLSYLSYYNYILHNAVLQLHKRLHCKRHYKRCISLLLRHGRGAEYRDRPVCLCVCLSVREHISGTARRSTDLHEILCADPVWPWFGPPLAALHYVMYFRFYG